MSCWVVGAWRLPKSRRVVTLHVFNNCLMTLYDGLCAIMDNVYKIKLSNALFTYCAASLFLVAAQQVVQFTLLLLRHERFLLWLFLLDRYLRWIQYICKTQ
jgi:hypothetical protein